MLDGYLVEKDIVVDRMMEVGGIEAIKRSVASNLGVAILPRYVVEDELENGMLQEIPTGITGEKITAICVYHKNKWISPAMELFLHLLKEKL